MTSSTDEIPAIEFHQFPWWNLLQADEQKTILELASVAKARLERAKANSQQVVLKEPEHEYFQNPEDKEVLASKNAVAVVYGASDDLVELGGELYEEYTVINKTLEVELNNGVKFQIYYDTQGVWRISLLEGGDKAVLDRLPTTGEASTGRYTDYLWVLPSETGERLKIAKKRKISKGN